MKPIYLLIFTIMLFVGRNLGEPSKTSEGISEKTSLSTRQTHPETNNDSVQKIRSQKSEQDRIRAAIALARSLPASEIENWIRDNKFTLRGSYARAVFQNILLERWSQENPVAFLSWIGEEGSREINFNPAHFFKNHPKATGEALSKAKNPDEQSRIFSLLASADPDQAISGLRKILPIEISRNPNFLISFISLVEKRPTEMEASSMNYQLIMPDPWRLPFSSTS